MKKYLLLSLTFMLVCCIQNKEPIARINPVVKNYKIDISCYRLHADSINYDSKYPLTITVKTIFADTKQFIYYNEGLTDYIDTLTIYKPDSIIFRNKLRFISQKEIYIKGKLLVVKKYRQKGNPYPYGNVYLNDSLGLILDRYLTHPIGESVTMYNTIKLYELHKAIVGDSIFFTPQWFD